MNITSSEFSQRMDKIRNLLTENESDALFVTLGKNFQYLLGSKDKLMERLVLGIIQKNGDPHLICPKFEVGNFEKNTPISKENIHPWEETENPFELLSKVSSNLDLTDGTIALSPSTPYSLYKKISLSLPKAVFFDAYPIFRKARINKTPTEVNLLKKANIMTAEAIESTFDQLEEGLTEKQVVQIVTRELQSRSGESVPFAIAQFGSNSSNPHAGPSDKKLNKNEVVLIDAGTTVEGYNGDITNTTFFGKPSSEFLEIYSIVEEAQELAVNASCVGALPEDVDNSARTFIESKGYGEYFTHRTGHGIGIEVHEDPYIVGGNKEPLELNQTHSVEPGIYITGKFGVRIEDIVIVGEKEGIRASQPKRRYWEKS